jgi:hypothetical protein
LILNELRKENIVRKSIYKYSNSFECEWIYEFNNIT